MADVSRINKKLREATFFLHKLGRRASKAFGDSEELDFYLSAFLSATRTVDYWLRCDFRTDYPPFHKTWKANLTPDESDLFKFMIDDRNVEVHDAGSCRVEGIEDIPIFGSYRDTSGTVTVSGPPPCLSGAVTPNLIHKPTRHYVINGQSEEITVVCRRYLDLLDRLVTDFAAAVP